MVEWHVAWLLALVAGIVSSGLVASTWKLATDEDLQLGDLFDAYPTFLTPFRAVAIILAAPMIVLTGAFWWLLEQPSVGVPLTAAGMVWSFLQGVFILTTVFGFD